MKKIIQRNLPLSQTYTITGYNYVPLIDGDGTCCDNCGKLISNMVYVTDGNGGKFTVGNDCAKTLTIPQSDAFRLQVEIEAAFNEGKALRSKIQTNLKKGNITGAYKWESKDGGVFIVFLITRGGSSMQAVNYPGVSLTYIKDILITKPE